MKARILHIGDAHLRDENHEDIKAVFAAMVADVHELNMKPDHVLLCGDICSSGKEEQYKLAHRILDDELLNPLGLEPERLLVVPGNHDVDRHKTLQAMEESWAKIPSREQLLEFIGDAERAAEHDLVRNKMSPYLKFSDKYRSITNDNIFVSSHVLEGEFKIGVVCINTAWLSSGFGDDSGRLLILDEQVAQHASSLRKEGAQCVVAMSHHPISCLREWNLRSAKRVYAENFDLVLTGHYHEKDSEMVKRREGCFHQFTCKSIHSGRMHCGYSIIELSKGLTATFRSWNKETKTFEADSTEGDGSYIAEDFVFQDDIAQTALEVIRVKDELIGTSSQLDIIVTPFEEVENISVADVFVEPVLMDACGADRVERAESYTVLNILNSCRHTLILGQKEYGKTTLLRYLQEQILNSDSVIVPVFIEFGEVPKNNPNGLIHVIRGKLNGACKSERIADYLENGHITILVDDFGAVVDSNYEKKKRMLAAFLQTYPKCRFIATATPHILQQDDVLSSLDSEVARYQLSSFNTAKVRDLLGKWQVYHYFNVDDLLKKVMKFFNRLRLPVTPFAATLFIGVLVGDRKQKNIYNEAYLVENYIETILQKVGDSGAVHDMDFPEKVSFMAFVAWKMYELGRYVLTVNEFEQYKVDFYNSFDEDLPDQDEFKIFFKKGILRKSGGEVSFQFRFAFYFFLAKALQKHPEGMGDIFDNDKVLLYARALSYKAGLERNDIGIIMRVGDLLDQKLIDHSKRYSTAKLEELGIERGLIDCSKNVKAEIEEGNREEVHDELNDTLYLSYDENDQEVKRQEEVDSIAELLILHSDIIRNSREIKAAVKRDELKKHIDRYQYLIFEVIEQFVYLLEGLEGKKLLSALGIKKEDANDDEVLKRIKGFIVQTIPVSAIVFIADHLGNPKLARSLAYVVSKESNKEKQLLYILVLYLLDSGKGEKLFRDWLDTNKMTYVLDNLAWMVIKYDAHTRKLSEREIDRVVSLLDDIRKRHPVKQVDRPEYSKDKFRSGTKKELLKSNEKFADEP